MNPENVPPWGCPWHGLVKGGQVYLPNGTQRPYPQPGDTIHNMAGNTSLLARPGVPEVERTEEEQEADAAAGRQWWNVAVRAGNRLHGREVPAGSWIYIDEAGDRWLASLNLAGATGGGTRNLTLRRFGVLGGAPTEYVYSVTVPDMEQATPAITGSDGTLIVLRHHSNPTGSASVFEVSAGFGAPLPGQPDTNRYWPRRPCGWVEVRLSGLGAECEVTVEVLKTRSQTLGSAYLNNFEQTLETYWLVEERDGGGVLTGTRLTTNPPPSGSDFTVAVYHLISDSAESSSGFDDYVVGMWYDNAGARHELKAFRHIEMTLDSPPIEHTGDTWFPVGTTITGTFNITQATTLSIRFGYLLDGVEVYAQEYSATESAEHAAVLNGSDAVQSGSIAATFTPGAALEDSYSNAVSARPATGISLGGSWFLGPVGSSADPGVNPERLSLDYRWGFAPTYAGQLPPPVRFTLYRYCNQLYGVVNWHLPESGPPFLYRYHYLPAVVTPGGLGALPEIDTTQSRGTAFAQFDVLAYGSWCPVTAQAGRDTEPVCFT